MTHFLSRLAFLAWVLGAAASTAGAAGAQADPQIERTRVQYAAESWPKGQLRDGCTFSALAVAGLAAEPARVDGGFVTQAFAASDGTTALVVELLVADSVAEAHETLLTWLAFRSSTERAPAAVANGRPVGEVGFVGYSGAAPKALSWMAFVRGNVAARVLVANGDAQVLSQALLETAVSLDRDVASRPALATGAALSRPAIEQLAAARARFAAGQSTPLEVAVAEPAQGAVQLVWSVGGTGQAYVERGADGAWVLHATAPGPIELALDVIGANGATARRTIALEATR